MADAKNILITGVSSGIGYALAGSYLAQGHRVFGIARQLAPLAELELLYPGQCLMFAADLTQGDQMQGAIEFIAQKTSALDLVILNAGSCEYLDVRNWDSNLFQRVMAINFEANQRLIGLVLPLLRASQAADRRLVGISSMAVAAPFPRAQAYGASKAALEYLLASLRVDLAAESIAVTIVRPGFVKTPLTARNDFPMPFLIDPNAAAQRISQGIARGKHLVQFPHRLVWLIRCINLLPTRWQVLLLTQLSRNK